MSLDANLVAAQWGLVSAFGIAVTLLAPKADQYRQDYLRTANVHDGDRARQWGRLVRTTPIAVLVGVLLLSILAAPVLPVNWTGIREGYSILIAPILAQIGFIYLLVKLVPALPERRMTELLDVPNKLPSSPASKEDTVITIANKSNRPLTLWWLDENGKPTNSTQVRMMSIAAGIEQRRSTKAWHYWLVRTQYGTNVGIIEAKDEPTVTNIIPERVERVWLEPQDNPLHAIETKLPASLPSTGDTVVIISNKSNRQISLCWLDESGSLNRGPGMPIIPAGQEREVWTRPSHYWLVRTENDAIIGIVQARSKPTVTEVDQEAVAKSRHLARDAS